MKQTGVAAAAAQLPRRTSAQRRTRPWRVDGGCSGQRRSDCTDARHGTSVGVARPWLWHLGEHCSTLAVAPRWALLRLGLNIRYSNGRAGPAAARKIQLRLQRECADGNGAAESAAAATRLAVRLPCNVPKSVLVRHGGGGMAAAPQDALGQGKLRLHIKSRRMDGVERSTVAGPPPRPQREHTCQVESRACVKWQNICQFYVPAPAQSKDGLLMYGEPGYIAFARAPPAFTGLPVFSVGASLQPL
mmetsp:Transcript_24332/g.72226  ORF Transcript_24332/g.72226 Transcript_24332/m.72226 type:complete len:246 (+) Transcript_24332:108-845(+)